MALIVNYHRPIFLSTDGHPLQWNDETIVKFDTSVMDFYSGEIHDNFVFELYELDCDGEVATRGYCGC